VSCRLRNAFGFLFIARSKQLRISISHSKMELQRCTFHQT
jgi:hypothetical protein